MAEYVFEGEIIKLTAKDFAKWQEMYKCLNLTAELEQLDMELEAKQREGGSVKKWFSECVARLNGRNKRAERFGRGSNQQPYKQSHSDNVRGQAQREYERLHNRNGSGAVRTDRGTLPQ